MSMASTIAGAVATGALFGSTATAQELAFPMDVLARTTADGRLPANLELQPRANVLGALGGWGHVVLTDVPLPGGALVDLDLDRAPIRATGIEVRVDGELRPEGLEVPDLTLWSGTVVGDEESEVFLALSAWGSRGWIRREGDVVHLLAAPGEDGDWANSRCRMVTESGLNAAGHHLDAVCLTDELTEGPLQTEPTPIPSGSTGGAAALVGGQPVLLCKMALETDYHFYAEFGNLNAAEAYATSLFGAMGLVYETQTDVQMDMVYLGLYTNPNDPWTSPETGGVGDLLGEFQGAWAFNVPNGANISHIITGANIGGGVAWVDVICNQEYGFAASASLHGDTPFPVTQGPLIWDFYVFAHETGHTMGSGHTHNYCPPLDQCAPSEYFGPCQNQQVCTSSGTMMSYCHLCDGGVTNVVPSYHPVVADVIRQAAENSCLPTICSATAVSYCANTPNSTGSAAVMGWAGSTSVSASNLTLFSSPIPVGNQGLFYYGPEQGFSPLGDGFRCVGNGTVGVQRLDAVTSDFLGSMQFPVDYAASYIPSNHRIDPGETWYFQCWFRDPQAGGTGFNFSDALCLTFCP